LFGSVPSEPYLYAYDSDQLRRTDGATPDGYWGAHSTVASTNPEVVTLDPFTGSQYLRIAISKNPSATDVTFTVEATSNLANPASWGSANLTIESDTSHELVVRDYVAAAPGVQRFMRVKVISLRLRASDAKTVRLVN